MYDVNELSYIAYKKNIGQKIKRNFICKKIT